ncbi:helix-turn-helix transcriptional regulator [Kitasatospora sp. NPDC001175]|uniref:helix-turn-helix transcriptional regulator n=1 Tax=Kitasatospora sp. NPDC001175 TaxID=3157103 RepID=UPI003CFCA8C2
MHGLRPVANGIRTDHPVPDLPFVDDSHIPVEDPQDIEKVGRNVADGMWGRWDRDRSTEGAWLAFTTDPIRHDLAWCVRYHPEHGRSVLLYDDKSASSAYMDWWGAPLLFRCGGYWWDGTTWYRPSQVWDAASEEFDRRPVRAAVTVSAADLLDDSTHQAKGRVLKIANFNLEEPPPAAPAWLDDLAHWAALRKKRGAEVPLSKCVVKPSAPELAGDQLIGVTELAELGGIAASTLRAYISRGEGDVPPPQAVVGGRSAWARPVAQDWAERRRRSADSVSALLAGRENSSLSTGAEGLRERFARIFFSYLWERPERRKRWALRHRTEDAVRQVADELGWSVAANLDDIVPAHAMAVTIRHAILDELAYGQELDREIGGTGIPTTFYGITTPVAEMLDWLVRHHPIDAQHAIGEIVGEAERRFDIPRQVSAASLRTALSLDGKLDATARREYLERVLPPSLTKDA